MARQNINKGTSANDGTGDTLRVAAGKINDNFSELYTLLGGDSAQVTAKVSLADSGVVYTGLSHNTVLGMTEGGSKSTILLPGTSGTVTLNAATQTLTNKTMTSPVLTTPQINDTSADHQYVFAVSELAADRTITLPLLTGPDEFTFKDHTQTLTNKTLTTPTIYAPKVQGHINDSDGNKIIDLSKTNSAVNQIQITNAATTGIPQIAATGTDSDVHLGLSGTNRGLVHIQTGIRYKSDTITSTGQAISRSRALTLFSAGGAISATLPSGTYVGETKILANVNSGEVTITPHLFLNGTSFSLRQNAILNCVWLDSASGGWALMTPKVYASTDAAALYYVTA